MQKNEAFELIDKAINGDSKVLRMIPPKEIADAFLSCKKRKVDKLGCILRRFIYENSTTIHMST